MILRSRDFRVLHLSTPTLASLVFLSLTLIGTNQSLGRLGPSFDLYGEVGDFEVLGEVGVINLYGQV